MVPRTARMSFGVEPSDGPEEAMYSTPLMLRWIARCTSDWTRSEMEARSRPAAGAFIYVLPPMADAWCAAAARRPSRRLGPVPGGGRDRAPRRERSFLSSLRWRTLGARRPRRAVAAVLRQRI